GRMRDLILQLSKSSIYSTKPFLIRPGESPDREARCDDYHIEENNHGDRYCGICVWLFFV
ncbi:hypothetical protein ACOTX7_22400, partial [Enterobacter cloacae complex sp. IR5418]